MKRQLQSPKILVAMSILGGIIFFGGYAMVNKVYNNTVYYQEKNLAPTQSMPSTHVASSVSLLFVGDMMFDRHIRKMALHHGDDFLFSCIDPLLKEHDVVIGNLEGPITTKPSKSMNTVVGSKENYYFTFPTSTASLLFNHNIKVVNIGNNHIANQGVDGIIQTKKFLEDNHIAFFGGLAGDSFVYRRNENGIEISFINYNQFGGEKEEAIARTILEEKSHGRIVIIYAHWGEEYKEVTAPIRATARLFAESGADIIVGSHPHVVQTHEIIGTTIVYYSLGNFIFDQYFQPEVMEGMALSVEISRKRIIGIREHFIRMNKDGRTCLAKNDASS